MSRSSTKTYPESDMTGYSDDLVFNLYVVLVTCCMIIILESKKEWMRVVTRNCTVNIQKKCICVTRTRKKETGSKTML